MGDKLLPINFGAGRHAIEIALGYGHSCARLDNGAVKCWGDNQSAQLGLGDKLNRGDQLNEMGDNLPAVNLGTGRTAVELALGLSFTCARLDNNAVKCWGQAPGIPGIIVGDSPSEMGDALPEVDFGLPGTVVQIAATVGNQNLCARSSTGTVLCMGLSNAYGQLGSGLSSSAFWRYVGVPNNSLAPINFGTNRTAIDIVTAGVTPGGTGCALLDDSSLKCWGLNDAGQLGQGDIIDRGDAAGEVGNNLLPINLGTGLTATSMSVSPLGACAILNNNDLKCWGHYMLLGSGQYPAMTHTGDAAGEMGDVLQRVNLGTDSNAQPLTAVQLATTTMSVCAILNNGLIKCWGSNGGGILGNPAPNGSFGWHPNEMGNNLPYVDLGQ
jgi:hypothetical protein